MVVQSKVCRCVPVETWDIPFLEIKQHTNNITSNTVVNIDDEWGQFFPKKNMGGLILALCRKKFLCLANDFEHIKFL